MAKKKKVYKSKSKEKSSTGGAVTGKVSTGSPAVVEKKSRKASLKGRCTSLAKKLTATWMKNGCSVDDPIVDDLKIVNSMKLHHKAETVNRFFNRLHTCLLMIDSDEAETLKNMQERVMVFANEEEMLTSLKEIEAKYK